MALKVLATVVEGNKSDLKDFTHIGGLGADAGDDLNRLFEIKAHGGEIPDSVTVQLSQVRAAKKIRATSTWLYWVALKRDTKP